MISRSFSFVVTAMSLLVAAPSFAQSALSLDAVASIDRAVNEVQARTFEMKFPKKTLNVSTFTLPDGKLEQYMVAAIQ